MSKITNVLEKMNIKVDEVPSNGIYVSGDVSSGNVYLTSGLQPPTDFGSFISQLKVHSDFQSYASGGAVFHINLNEEVPADIKDKMLKNMFNNYTVRYVSLTPVLTICNSCGCKRVGKIAICPNCSSSDVSIWSRPVGYFRPVARGSFSSDLKSYRYKFWLSGRIEEFSRRKLFGVGDIYL